MHTEIRAYHAMTSRDILARVALQRASIMHLVDLKRGGYSPCRTELRIDRLTDRPIAGRGQGPPRPSLRRQGHLEDPCRRATEPQRGRAD